MSIWGILIFIKGTLSRDFRPVLGQKTLYSYLGPIWTDKNCFANFFILDEKQVTEPEELNPDDVTFVNIKNLEQLATTSKNIFDLEDKNKKLFSL